MPKHINYLLLLIWLGIATFTSAFSQIPAPTFRWAQPLSNASDLSCMKVSPAGNVYVSGAFKQGGVCFDTTYSHCQNALGEGGDAFLAKYNRDGVLQWAKLIGSKYDEGMWGPEFDIDEQENIYLWGRANGDSLYVGDSLTTSPKKNTSAYLLKIDTKGKLKWINNWKGMTFTQVIFKHNRLYLNGYYTTTLYGLPAPFEVDSIMSFGTGYIQTPLTNEFRGLVIAQISLDNELISHQLLPSTFDLASSLSEIYRMYVLADGTMLLHGVTYDSLAFKGGTIYITNPADDFGDFFLVALDNNYQFKWGEVYEKGMAWGDIRIYPQAKDFLLWVDITYNTKTYFLGDTVKGDYSPKYMIFRAKSDKTVLSKKEGNGGIWPHKGEYYGGIWSEGDTIDFFGCPVIEPDTNYWSVIFRIDDSCNIAWQRKVFKYGNFIDRNIGISGFDSLNYIYGSGAMRQFGIYLDSILVKPLAFTMENELFIFGMTKDSFPPKVVPLPPPIDTIATAWNIFPNPFQNELWISGEFALPQLSLTFWDVAGRKISNQTLTLTSPKIEQKIPLPTLSSGMYLLEISDSKQKKWVKVWKN